MDMELALEIVKIVSRSILIALVIVLLIYRR